MKSASALDKILKEVTLILSDNKYDYNMREV